MESNVKVLESKVDSHEKRISSLEAKSEEMTKISTLLEIATKQLEETRQQTQQQAETLMLINNNMSHMNESLKNHGKRLENLETKHDKLKDNSKIDIIAILKNVALVGLTGAILYLWGLN